jgi:hypothetical protein
MLKKGDCAKGCAPSHTLAQPSLSGHWLGSYGSARRGSNECSFVCAQAS